QGDLPGKIEPRLDRKIVLRAGAFDDWRRTNIQRSCRLTQAHIQVGIRPSQTPELCRPPFRSYLHALGNAEQSIPKPRGKQNVRWHGIAFQKRRPRDVLAEQIAVVVVKTCYVHINILAYQSAISQFVSVQLLRPEVAVRVEAREKRQPVRDSCESRQEEI